MLRDTVLFDINETVLDLGQLKPKFKAAFEDDTVTAIWFSTLLHTSTVCILTGVKTRFSTLAGNALDKVAALSGVVLSEELRNDILRSFARLAPHSDIKPALTRLKMANYRTVAFSNSSQDLVTCQIDSAGLSEYFDEIISVEESGSFKPDPGVYEFAGKRLDRPIETLRLVAAHDWDTHGALSAGMLAAYIDRTGAPYQPQYRQPDVIGKRMEDIVEQIIVRDAG